MNQFLYIVFLWIYKTGIRVVSPWNRKASLWLKGRSNIFSVLENSGLQGREQVVWMHCASLGEFEQGRPVAEHLKKLYPEMTLVITFFSPSGYEVMKDYAGADYIFYLPADSRRNARRFIDIVKPELVLWIKYDYWYYYLTELKTRKIPVLLISAVFREDQPFFKRYGKMHREMLDCFKVLFVQTTVSQSLLARIGLLESVFVIGDTRFDRVVQIAAAFEPIPDVGAFCGTGRVIVAGSTWEEDEEELDHYANTHPDVKFIIAPHQVESGNLKDLEGLFHNSVRYSMLQKTKIMAGAAAPNVLIIDNIGMLSRLYHYATIAYVGGGFGDDGVHNVLEAAVFGKPVVMGPVIDKYIEAMELVECGGGIIVDNALEAESVFERLFNKSEEYLFSCEASRRYVDEKKGATEKITGYIQENRLLTS